jgi:hypothetical protein
VEELAAMMAIRTVTCDKISHKLPPLHWRALRKAITMDFIGAAFLMFNRRVGTAVDSLMLPRESSLKAQFGISEPIIRISARRPWAATAITQETWQTR